MSEENVEIPSSLRRVYEAYSRGDFDTAMQLAHPEIELIPPGGQSSLRGAEAVRRWMEPDALLDQRVELLDCRINGNRALIRQRSVARGAKSGIEIDIKMWAVWTLNEDGLATRIEAFLIDEESAALEAAGLSE
jgi:ketosteroid isomerase-like protein